MPQGLEYDPSGLLERKPREVVPLSEIDRFGIKGATFQLWKTGQDQPVIRMSAVVPNFFPGLTSLTRLVLP